MGTESSAAKSDSIQLRPKKQQYVVSGNDLVTLLRSARDEWGFTFTTSVTESTVSSPSCTQDLDKIDFNLPGIQMGVTFGATKTIGAFFFGGRNLNPYWQIKEMRFIPGSNYDAGVPEKTSINAVKQVPMLGSPLYMARYKFTARPKSGGLGPSGEEDLCWITNIQLIVIILEGPEGQQWRDAFRIE